MRGSRFGTERWIGVMVGVALVGAFVWGVFALIRFAGTGGEEGGGTGSSGPKDTREVSYDEDIGPLTAYDADTRATFEALVVLRDQSFVDPEQDRREALKRGDVLAVRKAPHQWSDTEWRSYLVVRFDFTGKEANELIESEKNGEAIVRARKRFIDLEKLGFTDTRAPADQPFVSNAAPTDVIRVKQ